MTHTPLNDSFLNRQTRGGQCYKHKESLYFMKHKIPIYAVILLLMSSEGRDRGWISSHRLGKLGVLGIILFVTCWTKFKCTLAVLCRLFITQKITFLCSQSLRFISPSYRLWLWHRGCAASSSGVHRGGRSSICCWRLFTLVLDHAEGHTPQLTRGITCEWQLSKLWSLGLLFLRRWKGFRQCQ